MPSLLPEGEIIRRDIPLIPRKVIREVIVNAVMHRNYKEKQPIQIIRFSDHLEIRNPGYSLKSPDELDQPGSKTRNEKIAGVLHDLNIAETMGSGIRTIFEEMLEANLTLPLFVSNRDRDYFHATLFTHHLLDQGDREWLKQFKDYDFQNLMFPLKIIALQIKTYQYSTTLQITAYLQSLTLQIKNHI